MSVNRIFLTFSIVLLLAGCGGSSSDDTDADTNNLAPVGSENSLTIGVIDNSHSINMQTIAQAYTDQTGTALSWVALEENALRAQVTGESDNTQYDIINIGMQEAPIWGAADWLQPLNFSDAYDVDDIFPTVRSGLSYQGDLHAAPFYGESSMLVYRKDLADAAAVQINDNDSWDNIQLAASAMHNPDEDIYGICLRGRPGWGDNIALFTTIANSFGAKWFDADLTPQLDSIEWNTAAHFYVDLLTNYGPPNSEQNSFNEILALFNNGQCGMWIDATIAGSFINIEEIAYAQSPNAGFPNGASWLWAWGLAVPAGTSNTEQAMNFIEWATSKEYIQAVANHPDFSWSSVPTGTRASTYAIPEFQEIADFAAAEKIAIESASPAATDQKPYLGIQFASIPEFPEIGAALGEELAAALSGTQTVEQAMAAAQAKASDILRNAGN